jgi:PAS domain S-box-containing protein
MRFSFSQKYLYNALTKWLPILSLYLLAQSGIAQKQVQELDLVHDELRIEALEKLTEDSLRKILAQVDIEKPIAADIFNILAEKKPLYQDSCIILSNYALDIARSIHYRHGIYTALRRLMRSTRVRSGEQAATDLLYSFYDKETENANKSLMRAVSAHLLSGMLQNQGLHEAAYKMLRESEYIHSEIDHLTGLGYSHRETGNFFLRQYSYRKALDQYEEALKIANSTNDKFLKFRVLNDISELYLHQQMPEQAAQTASEALQNAQAISYMRGIANSEFRLAHIYSLQRQYQPALQYISSAENKYRTQQRQHELPAILMLKAEILQNTGKNEEAYQSRAQALEISRQLGDSKEECRILIVLAKEELRNGNTEAALRFARLAFRLASALTHPDLLSQSTGVISEAYGLKSRYDSAWHYQKLHKTMSDSIFSQDARLAITRAELQYLHEQETEKIRAERAKSELALNDQLNRKQNLINLAILGLVLLSITLFIVYKYYQNNKEANHKLQKLNQAIRAQRQEIYTQASELKKSLTALAISEEKFRLLIEKNAAAIGIYTGNHHAYINPEFEHFFGYSLEELNNAPPFIIAHPDMRAFATHTANALLAGQELSKRYDLKCMDKQGNTLWVDLVAFRIEYNGQKATLVNMYNITPRKKVEEELMQMNEQLQASEEELRQQTEELIAINENLDKVQKQLKIAYQEEKEAREEAQKVARNLQTAQEHLVQNEKMAALGQLVASIAHEINTPLAATRAATENIKHAFVKLYSELPRTLSEMTEADKKLFMQLVNEAIQVKIQPSAKEERLYRYQLNEIMADMNIDNAEELAELLVETGIYHNIHPYMPLLRHPQSINWMNTAYIIVRQHRNIENIGVAVEKTSKIVFALRNYARQNSNTAKTNTNLVENIETILTLYHSQMKHGIEIERDYKLQPVIACFPDELSQVWTNLIYNALQAMEYKGKLRISIVQENEYIGVHIADTGAGIPPELHNKIFEPFFTTKNAGEGSGLGLDIVSRIIKKHDGKITVQSSPGKGAVFQVLLPQETIEA